MTLADFDHVGNADPFVRPVGEIENAGTVGDAIVQVADSGDMLLIVCTGRNDVVRLSSEDFANSLRDRCHDRRVTLRHQRQHLHQIPDRIVEFRPIARQPVENGCDLVLDRRYVFFQQETTVDDHPARVRAHWVTADR